MIDRTDSAKDCWKILCRMCLGKEACHPAHPIIRAMRSLQRRYSGVFPDELRGLWDKARLPIHPRAAVEYHDGVHRLKDWIATNFGFIEETSDDGSESHTTDSVSAVDWFGGDYRGDAMEDRLGTG